MWLWYCGNMIQLNGWYTWCFYIKKSNNCTHRHNIEASACATRTPKTTNANLNVQIWICILHYIWKSHCDRMGLAMSNDCGVSIFSHRDIQFAQPPDFYSPCQQNNHKLLWAYTTNTPNNCFILVLFFFVCVLASLR